MDKTSLRSNGSFAKDPIAIVGMSCRFPKISTLDDFWNLLVEGRDTIDIIKRWDIDRYFDADKTAKNKTHQRHSSLLENIDDFDPFFFNISPAEAAEMTPSQKLLLELAWEAVENSNMPFDRVMGEKAGVYVGNIWNDFEHLRKHKNAEITLHSSVGQSSNVIANRVSYFLGLTGPSLVVDTGCSTSLVALHLACQGLWEGNLKFAIAGGINHILDPDQNLLLSKFGGLSAKGKCSTFDRDVDGFVRGEGAGLLLLKKLSDAEKDGDHIYAVIRGTAMNNNGFNVNLPATSTKGQLDVLEEAYAGSGIEPGQVHYVETHGTGTKLGDPTECNAIGQFFGKNRTNPLSIGSVKTNLGHTEGAAGMAGLLKAVLAMNKGVIPKNLNFNTPNPDIDFEGLQLKVQSENSPWPTSGDETLKAGINSFGWGGTNAHTLIEEYRPTPVENDSENKKTTENWVLPLSGKSTAALEEYVQSYKELLTEGANDFAGSTVSTAIRKPKLSHGRVFAASSKEKMIEQLDQFLATPEVEGVEVEDSKVVFVFPGQGSQWLGMGKELYAKEPVFKEMIDACDQAFQPFTDWSLVDQIHADEASSRLNEISVIQPSLFAMQVSLAKLWMSFGVSPDAVVGHSMGEVASAFISGGLNLEDAANVICTRSKLMQTVSGQGGAMAVTELTVSEAEEFLKDYDGLSIAVNNSPKSTVIAGDQEQITKALEKLEADGRFCKQVKVDVASHSKQMDPLKKDLGAALRNIQPQETSIDLYSTVQNAKIGGEDLTADYWVSNLRSGVQFASTMEQLIQQEHTIFIEVSPHPVLVTAIQECLEAFEGKGVTSPTLLRSKPEIEWVYRFLDELYNKGLNVNWSTFYNDPELPYVELPGYPFQRATYSVTEVPQHQGNERGGHVLIGKEINLAFNEGVHIWNTVISTEQFSYISDRKVAGKILLPESASLEMIHAACMHVTGNEAVTISNVEFLKKIPFPQSGHLEVQVKLSDRDASFELFAHQDEHWIPFANGRYSSHIGVNIATKEPHIEKNELPRSDFYETLEHLELTYGSSYQTLTSLEVMGSTSRAQLKLSEQTKAKAKAYFIHPIVLESGLQTAVGFDLEELKELSLTPRLVSIESVQYFHPCHSADHISVESKLVESTVSHGGSLSADIMMIDESGTVCVKFSGVKFKLKRTADAVDHYYKVKWVPQKVKESGESFQNTALIVEEENRLTDMLQAELQKAGNAVTIIPMKNDVSWSSLLDWQTIDHVVYFANSPFDKVGNHINLNSSHQISRLFGAIETAVPPVSPKITLVTRSAVSFENLHINLNHAPLVGLTRVLANEFAKYQVSQIDMPMLPSHREMVQLAKVVTQKTDYEPQVAVRNDQTVAARLEKVDILHSEGTSFSDTTHHVLVGADEQVIPIMDWMTDHGAGQFTVLCEDDSLIELTNLVQPMINEGIAVDVRRYNRKEPASMYKVLRPLSEDSTIESLTYFDKRVSAHAFEEEPSDHFMRDVKTRANEAWLLHEFATENEIAHFILMASDSALTGDAKTTIGASTGSFLGGLASFRSRLGLPTSVFYMGSRQGEASAEGLTGELQKEALTTAITTHARGLGIFKWSSKHAKVAAPTLSESNFMAALMENSEGDSESSFLDLLHGTSSSEEKILLIERMLLAFVAKIIKSPVDQLSPKMKFKHLGVDSLMAVQFRNKIEGSFHVKMAISTIWAHPTAEALAVFLHDVLTEGRNTADAPKELTPMIHVEEKTSEPSVQLVCFHDAGGSASLFEDWSSRMGEPVEIIRVELPGRQGGSYKNISEINIADTISYIADQLEKKLTKPSYFLGHSMGGLFAFEVIHELVDRGFEHPKKLFISSTPQLNSYNQAEFDPRMNDEELVDRFPYLSEANTPDAELRTFLRSILRMDLALLDTYIYLKKGPLDLDIVAIRGEEDHTVSKEQMMKWQDEINGSFTFMQRPGDHHYIKQDQQFVTDLLLDEMGQEKVLVEVKQTI